MTLYYKRIIVGAFVIILCLLGKADIYAQKQPVSMAPPLIGDSVKTGKTLSVQDTVYYNPILNASIAQTNGIDNIVSLQLDEFLDNKLPPDTFHVAVRINVTYTTTDNANSSRLDTLNILYSRNNPYNNRAVKLYRNFRSVQVEILDVAITAATETIVRPLLRMDNMMVIDRNFTTNCSAITSVSHSDVSVTTDGELLVSWPAVSFIPLYDLEWTFIDQSAIDSGIYNNAQGQIDPQLIFKNNASRVSLGGNSYRIPLLYDGDGKVYFRVRTVQNAPDGEVIAGLWSTEAGSNGLGVYAYTGHQRNLNWQATTTYAEEGKRKSVVQYYDGSLKGRQTVTKDNTTKTTVVAETLYDKQGRPVIQVLPSPTLSRLIAYTPLFNQKGDIDLEEYDKSVYDTLINANEYCATGAPSMGTANGSSQYYSPANPMLSAPQPDHHRFVPNAGKYPFTETRYTRDNTGRIDRQGGVGTQFQIGTGHETKYYYGSAEQKDLDALFGTEVGDESHYEKNMVRDANGQYSVSYVDMHGRTIATALAGNSPGNLDQLASYNSVTQTDKLLTTTNNIIKDNNIQATKSILVPVNGAYQFNYSLSPESLLLDDCNNIPVCYDCLYDLTVTISDNCSNEQFGGSPVLIKRSNFSLFKTDGVTHNLDTTCTAANIITIDTTVNLQEGSYDITKTLTISKEGMQYYRDSLFLPHNICKTYNQLVLEILDSIRQHLDCTPDSATTNLAVAYREQMMADLIPLSGQYADTASERDCLSIFTDVSGKYLYQSDIVGTYLDGEGNPDFVDHYSDDGELQRLTPKQLSPEEFIVNFKDSWAEALLPLHPEYQLLLQYEKLISAYNWEADFTNTETYADAVAKGFLNPTGSANLPASKFTVSGKTDSLFIALGIHDPSVVTSAKQFIDNKLFQYLQNPQGYYTIWGLSTGIVKCTDNNNQACFDQWNETNNVFNTESLCKGDLDMAWRMFRSQYLLIREDWVDNYTRQKSGVYPYMIGAKCVAVFPNRDITSISADQQYGGYNGTEQDITTANNNLNKFLLDNCKAFATKWWQELAPCGYTVADSTEIIDRLIQVAYEGADAKHPFGASTVKPSSTHTDRSFEEVINEYNAIHYPSMNPVTCNAYLIIDPKPYDQPGMIVNLPIIAAPDSCSCSRINELYNQFLMDASGYSSFSNYMLLRHDTRISQGALDTLRSLCNNSNPTCKYLEKPILLPPSLQCGTGDVCVDCNVVKSLKDSFDLKFPGVVPTQEEPDTTQRKRNELFANYMNHHLGFSKTAQEFLQFMMLCDSSFYGNGGDSTMDMSGCDSLEMLVTEYQRLYVKPLSGYVDLDMRTFAGNKTPTEGPKGVFDVNGNLLGNTLAGTQQEINQSYAQIWNSSAANSAIGSLSALENGKFRLTLNANMTAPCDGIVGMRYYQFDAPVDTLDAVLTGPGCYIDFGDGNKERIVEGLNARGTNVSYGKTTTVAYRSYSVTDSSVITFRSFHKYADSLIKTVTVYHPDVQGVFGFDNNVVVTPLDLSKLINLRGYMPANTFNFIFNSGQQASFNSTDSIVNFNEVSSINYFGSWNGSWPKKGTLPNNTNFSSFENNHNLTVITSVPYDPVPATPNNIQSINEWFPDFKNNFNNLVNIRVTNYFGECASPGVDFSLPGLRSFMIQGHFTPVQLDSMIIQVARSTQDSGALSIYNYTGGILRTAASDAAFASLSARKWNLLGGGMNVTNPAPAAITLPLRDSFPLTNLFTEYFNSRQGTNYSFSSIKKLYEQTCNRPLDLCEIRGNLHPENSCDSTKWTVYNPGTNLEINTDLYTNSTNNIPPASQFFSNGHFNAPSPVQANHYVLVNKKDSINAGNATLLMQWRLKPNAAQDMINPFIRRGNNTTYIGAEWIKDPTDTTWWIGATILNGADGDTISGMGLQSNSHGLQADWVKITNPGTGDMLYFDDFLSSGNCSGTSAGPFLCGKQAADSSMVLNMNPCADTMFSAVQGADYLFEIYRQKMKGNFENAYMRKCLDAGKLESFTVTHPLSEYHYTLYYYDQAGNLVKTVPPEGVHPNRTEPWFESVKQARNGGTHLPAAHTLTTTYRYNSLNQVISQHSPDGGLSRFWYDRLGRLVVSQNAKQAAEGNYSYTLYDHLGRITEVGQKKQIAAMTDVIARNQATLGNWLNYTYTFNGSTVIAEQVTNTVYDIKDPQSGTLPLTGYAVNPGFQKAYTLRNRVSFTRYFDKLLWNGSAVVYYPDYDNSTTYSYDIHGNVDTLLHNYRTGFMAQHSYNKYKTTAYRYDLISGKVNEVHYQPGMPDELYHRYDYDAENRLTDVYITDRKALISIPGLEEHEAFYQYYKHGPLARTVLGQQQVQGIDYAYTLQGWLKGVNTDNTTDDANTGKDAYNFSLHYFAGDYNPIGNTIPIVNAAGNTAFKNLYNGNIGAMAVNIKKLNQPLVYNYKYDQLNRLVMMDAYTGWNGINIFAPDKTDDYHEEITYDANGNILSYLRNGTIAGGKQLGMDNLQYGYNKDVNGEITNNKLRHVKDDISLSGNYTEDIDNQSDDNYTYDAIGNLVSDNAENITDIQWSVYGKILKITKTAIEDGDVKAISYTYDVAGNRISKKVEKQNQPDTYTWYVRDASGNVMATYNGSGSGLTLSEQHIYGSSRIGIWNRNIDMDVSPNANNNIFTRGNKFFELTNHLGNVLATVSDRKFYIKYGAGSESNGGCDQGTAKDNLEVPLRGTETSFVARLQVDLVEGFDSNNGDDFTVYTDDNLLACEPQTTPPAGADYYYMPDVVSANDYYPFGMGMPGRKYSGGTQYRYGFNGKERDKDMNSVTAYDYGFRIYNPAIGKFLSVDPLTKDYPWYTPYQFAGNMPIWAIDLDGLEQYYGTYEGAQAVASIFSSKQAKTFTKEEIRALAEARADQGAQAAGLTAIILVDVYLTKGKLTQTYLLSQGLGLAEHNRAKTPEGRTAQDARFKENSLDFVKNTAGGYIVNKLAMGLMALASESRKLYNFGAKALGEMGEEALARQYGTFKPSGKGSSINTSEGLRKPDGIPLGTTVSNTKSLFESKVGFTEYSGRVVEEVAKDAELIASGKMEEITWIFYRSPTTGRAGASDALLNELNKAGIKTQIAGDIPKDIVGNAVIKYGATKK